MFEPVTLTMIAYLSVTLGHHNSFVSLNLEIADSDLGGCHLYYTTVHKLQRCVVVTEKFVSVRPLSQRTSLAKKARQTKIDQF